MNGVGGEEPGVGEAGAPAQPPLHPLLQQPYIPKLTIYGPMIYTAQYVMCLMGAKFITRAIGRVGP